MSAAQSVRLFGAILGMAGIGAGSRGCAPENRPPAPPEFGFGMNSSPGFGNGGFNSQQPYQSQPPVQESYPIQNQPPVQESYPAFNLPPSSYVEGYQPPSFSIDEHIESYQPSNIPPSYYYEGYQPSSDAGINTFYDSNNNNGNNNNNSGYEHHNWNKVGPSGKYEIHNNVSNSRKEAYDRAQRAGHGHTPIEHPGHFHATDAYGNKIPGSHYSWGGQ